MGQGRPGASLEELAEQGDIANVLNEKQASEVAAAASEVIPATTEAPADVKVAETPIKEN